MSDPPTLGRQIAGHWEIAANEVAVALRQTLAIAFLGSASSGKDAAIRALFGIDFGQIDPVPGSTDRVRVAAIDPERRVLVVNAPGFGDLRSAVQAEAEAALQHLDLAVYIVNCDGGATADERRDLDRIRALSRPTLLCLNKVDLVRPALREEFVRVTLAQLGVSETDAVVTAFDPLPALAPEPIGVDRVIAWIHRQLHERGKALLFAKSVRNRSAACEVVIRAAARRAALAGALPIPGADATAVTIIQVQLVTDLAAIFGRRIDREVVLFIVGEALAGTSRRFVRWALDAAKAAGWIPGGQAATIATSALGATIASASTYGVGKAAIAWLQRDGLITTAEMHDVFDAEAIAWRDRPDPTA